MEGQRVKPVGWSGVVWWQLRLARRAALNVKRKKFSVTRVNGGSKWESLKVAWG